MSLVVNPYSYFTDTNGNALNGYLYVGEVGKNAENYPIAIFYDALFTTPAPNPLTISAGYIYNSGTIAQIYASVDYSIVVKKTDGSLVYSSLNETGMTNGAIANIDEMKNFVAPYDNYALNVLGYSEAGDGGGGVFYYDANSTEADNGGTIIEPTSGSGRWIRVVPLYTQAYTIETVDDFDSIPPGYTTAIVKDIDKGGTFIWSSTGTANDGTVFAGATGYWNRQYEGAVNVKWFGAVGDGVTDDTDAIQNALDSNALYITGDNAEYVVTTIYPQSNQTITDMRLLRKATATQVSLEPVIKISGDGLTVENVTLQNIIINGNRQNLEDIVTSNGEDGGMHGFKISDGANNIKLINCAANYCGSAGLAIHSEGSSTSADYPITNIYLENFVATYNREHGMFGDSFDGLHINGMNSSYNGLTIASGYPDTNGNTAFKNGGVPFGSGFDFECYLGYPLSYFKNVYASDVVCIGNSTSCMVYAPPVVDAVAEIPAQNIFLKNVYFEKGANAGTTDAFTIYANSYVGEKYGVDNVQISGFLDGIFTSNNARRVSIVDGYIKAPTELAYKSIFNNGKDSSITVPSNKVYVNVETFSASSITTGTGAGVLTGTFSPLMQSNGVHTIIMPFSISGGIISGGPMSFTITLPTQVKAVSAQINAFNSTSGISVVSNVSVLSETQVRVFITPIDDNVSGKLEVEILL